MDYLAFESQVDGKKNHKELFQPPLPSTGHVDWESGEEEKSKVLSFNGIQQYL